MYDIERITKIITDIEKYEKELENIKIKSVEELENNINFNAASMLCFAILNRVVDLGQEILVKEGRGMPERYADVFIKLSEAGFMNKEEAEEINKLIDFRNIIAHTYFELSKKDVLKIVKAMNLINKFIEKVKKAVKRGGRGK